MNPRVLPPILTICLVNALILLLGGTAAIVLCSGRAVERTGAVIAAATSLFVIWQVVEEIRLDAPSSTAESHEEEVFLLPIERTAARLQAAAKRREEHERHRERLRLVGVIALWLFIGELLHGFGDVIYDGSERLFS
jgi:hypothetical protein